jgi:hypothetical protein
VFDIRGPKPSPTPLAALARQLARGGMPGWAQLQEPGWWQQPVRLLYPPVDREGRDVMNGSRAARQRRLDGAA